MKKTFTAILISSILLISGCSIHKVDIQQGNIIDAELVKKLTLGMDKKQIKFILGEPLVTSAFSNNSWNYIYSLQLGDGSKSEIKHLSLLFKDDTLSQIINNK
ncbi:MAG: outer membrane protein assembly factor BamE [Gammaproteobacteria bacterium]|nr:outer membrane protein assembly factor BamE [Gammaproteobacteria bacterium]